MGKFDITEFSPKEKIQSSYSDGVNNRPPHSYFLGFAPTETPRYFKGTKPTL